MESIELGWVSVAVLVVLTIVVCACQQIMRAWRKTEPVRRKAGAVVAKGAGPLHGALEAANDAVDIVYEASDTALTTTRKWRTGTRTPWTSRWLPSTV